MQLHAPPFPPFVRQLVKDGECYSWGAFGWMLNSGKINVKKYTYFVLVDSSVRGPFIAPYVPVRYPPLRIRSSGSVQQSIRRHLRTWNPSFSS